MLAKIDGTDISKNIITNSYEVNEEDVVNTWTDGNKVVHRDIIRQKVKGSFNLKFTSPREYESFCRMVKEKRRLDHRIPMTLYIVNADEERNLEVFYRFAPTITKNLAKGKTFARLKFEVEEP